MLVLPMPTPTSRICLKCGATNDLSSRSCAHCGAPVPPLGMRLLPTIREGPESPPMPLEESRPASHRPFYASLFLTGAGVLDMASAVITLHTRAPATDIPIDFSGLILFCGILVFFLSLCAFGGAYLAYKQGSLSLILAASIAAMLGVGPFLLGFVFGFIALIIVALSTEQFSHPEHW